jgi:hypothetical protein
MLSKELMNLMSIQSSNENMGVPISDGILQECQRILNDRYVTLFVHVERVQFDNNQFEHPLVFYL